MKIIKDESRYLQYSFKKINKKIAKKKFTWNIKKLIEIKINKKINNIVITIPDYNNNTKSIIEKICYKAEKNLVDLELKNLFSGDAFDIKLGISVFSFKGSIIINLNLGNNIIVGSAQMIKSFKEQQILILNFTDW